MNRVLLILFFLGLVHGTGQGRPASSLKKIVSQHQTILSGSEFKQVGFGPTLGTLDESEELERNAVIGKFPQWNIHRLLLGIGLCDLVSPPSLSSLFASLHPRAPPVLS